MRILHTSDWHIGRSLYGKRRYAEMESFLAWLEKTIADRRVDTLLIAGDIFDTTTPSNQAQELYYRFLQRLAGASGDSLPLCRHVVIIAGNHDSPTFLDAPKELLALLNIHVRGRASALAADEVLLLRSADSHPELIVCAVPYLHDRDVRVVEAGEDMRDRQRALIQGISRHYADVLARACELQSSTGVPIVLMGHVFVTGGTVAAMGDGVRELYVGAQVQLGFDELLPPELSTHVSYTALGHLHIPQRVGGECARYSGSPIPMGFGEAGQQKSVCLVDVGEGKEPSVELLPIPLFQRLERVNGNWETIERHLTELRLSGTEAWLEVTYEGEGPQMGIPDLQDRLNRCLEDCSGLELLCTRDEARIRRTLEGQGNGGLPGGASLEDLSPLDVFERRLEAVPEEQREALRRTYREVLARMEEEGGTVRENFRDTP
ncbi:MAG: exonuclease SbcCD subunit D C-terminal domain-containing protein [Fretibacterium sp.]|nr:exonuclease SbcCD subunit D C-terminal domain-containing protein [Fretibacterium sp.]